MARRKIILYNDKDYKSWWLGDCKSQWLIMEFKFKKCKFGGVLWSLKILFYSILSVDLIVIVINMMELNRNIVCNRYAINIDEFVVSSEPFWGVNKKMIA